MTSTKYDRTDTERPKRDRLRIFNNCLTIVVALVAVYIMAAPVLPQFGWWLQHDSPVRAVVPPKKVTPPVQANSAEDAQQAVAATGDQLTIPSLAMQETVHGGGIASLRKGVWRLPYTSTPAKGGNTVLVGHRFTYGGQAVFYHLDKVKTGDRISLYWDGKNYEYAVTKTMVVPADATWVEADSKEPRLTLYTCTPLWSAKDRLVIQAKLLEDNR